MAAGLVIGICSNSDTKALDDALSAQQIDLEKVKVFAADGDDLESSPLDFIEVFSESEYITGLSDDMTRGTGVLADLGGTNVPGLTGEPRFKAFFPDDGESKHYLAGLPVPDDEVDNFDDAIAETPELRYFDLDEVAHCHRAGIGGCACQDQVARKQCDMPREIGDDVINLKDHLADGAFLY